MKALLFTLLASAAAHATTLNCVVPQEGAAPVITATIEATTESQGDFLTLTIKEAGKELVYFNQLEKGGFDAGLQAGSVVTLVVSESVRMENGALKGAGLLAIQKDGAALGGFASINDTFYPLQCK